MNKRLTLVAWAASAFLSACGGGGSTDGTTPAGSNTAPVANAGPTQSVMTGTTVTLNASASTDANGDTLTYQWTLDSKPIGSAARLSNATAVMPTLSVDVAGSYVFSLTVNDGKSSSTVSHITVTAAVANAAPVANAGVTQNVTTGSVVTLDGTASSDVNGDALSYLWALTTKPLGSVAVLSKNTVAMPTFTADLTGTYEATLTVSDGQRSSVVNSVTVIAAVANAAPVANAGRPYSVNGPTPSGLTGVGSYDPNGDLLTYAWTITSKPSRSSTVLINPTSQTPILSNLDIAGVYVASLIVSDGKLSSVPASVAITVPMVNSAPVAVIGGAQSVSVGATAVLDGSGSWDPSNTPVSYSWTLDARPSGSAAVLNGANTVNPNVLIDVPGEYVVSLVVSNGRSNSSQSSSIVTTAASRSIGVPYLAPNGVTVTLNYLKSLDLGNGLTRYSASLTESNNGTTLISSNWLSLFMQTAGVRRPDSFVGQIIYPGPESSVTSVYEYDISNSSSPLLWEYASNSLVFRPTASNIQWFIPTK